MVSEDLIKIVQCIKCQGDLKLVKDKLVCVDCNQEYIIKDDIPVMLDEDFRV